MSHEQLHSGEPTKIVANLVEDATNPDDCQLQLQAAKIEAELNPAFFVERIDRDEWGWPFAEHKTKHSSDRLVKDVINSEARGLLCIANKPELLHDGVPLDPTNTLSEAGVRNGDVLQLRDAERPSKPFSVGFTEFDIFPETRHLHNWDRACGVGPIALDSNSRSLGIDANIPDGQAIASVELRNRTGSSKLNGSDYRLFTSSDNVHYTEINDWTFSSRIENGKLVHTFSDLNVSDRYLKISQPYSQYSGYTFVINNTDEDVQVQFSPKQSND